MQPVYLLMLSQKTMTQLLNLAAYKKEQLRKDVDNDVPQDDIAYQLNWKQLLEIEAEILKKLGFPVFDWQPEEIKGLAALQILQRDTERLKYVQKCHFKLIKLIKTRKDKYSEAYKIMAKQCHEYLKNERSR